MTRRLALLAAAAALALPALAHAAPVAAQVHVVVGPELAAKSRRYGDQELAFLATQLAKTVRDATGKGGFTRLELVLEDARPNRPTFAMMSREPTLSLRSLAIGGAKITGTAYRGEAGEPLKTSWFETDLSQEHAASTWTDAERAFDFLAGDLAHGRVPQRFGPGTPGPERATLDPRDPWTRDD